MAKPTNPLIKAIQKNDPRRFHTRRVEGRRPENTWPIEDYLDEDTEYDLED